MVFLLVTEWAFLANLLFDCLSDMLSWDRDTVWRHSTCVILNWEVMANVFLQWFKTSSSTIKFSLGFKICWMRLTCWARCRGRAIATLTSSRPFGTWSEFLNLQKLYVNCWGPTPSSTCPLERQRGIEMKSTTTLVSWRNGTRKSYFLSRPNPMLFLPRNKRAH